MLPFSRTRVPEHTPAHINEEILKLTERNIACFAAAGNDMIDRRLRELDEEWDIERVFEASAAVVGLAGAFFGLFGRRRWLLLSGTVAGFMMQNALQGWCPPMDMFRRFGFRTRDEIDYERYGLKALRGDFKEVSPAPVKTNLSEEAHKVLMAEMK